MGQKDWDKFFELLGMIVSMPGYWGDNMQKVLAFARQNGQETSLVEFVSWFQGEE